MLTGNIGELNAKLHAVVLVARDQSKSLWQTTKLWIVFSDRPEGAVHEKPQLRRLGGDERSRSRFNRDRAGLEPR
jgi:hypothetical protein